MSKKNHQYKITVEEELDLQWAAWFGNFAITHNDERQTVFSGAEMDQSQLFGALTKIRDLGLTLVSVKRVPL